VYRKYERIAQKTFVVIAVTLLSMCATFILLYSLYPRYRAPLATANTENSAQASKPIIQNRVSVIATPVNLKISKIGVDTTMAAVGVDAKGNMDIDENPKQAAWYKLGAKPGEEGSAVIAGHYGWKNGVSSVFNDLHMLVKGDKFSTVGEDGKVMTFVVTRLATYAPDQDATNVFRSDDGKAHLNLVTCQGAWNNSQSTYSERLVVFSDLVVQ
jgi:LPXTG-site transpeptidase (sortase) family protein